MPVDAGLSMGAPTFGELPGQPGSPAGSGGTALARATSE
jgi:hypothetical protein